MSRGEYPPLWQTPDWPEVRYEPAPLLSLLADLHHAQGRLQGRMQGASPVLRLQVERETWLLDALGTGALDGEPLAVDAARTALDRRLGFMAVGTRVHPEAEGTLALVVEASREPAQPITPARLEAWHAGLYPTGYAGLVPIHAGRWRRTADPPGQLVLGATPPRAGRRPPADQLPRLVGALLDGLAVPEPTDPYLRAGAAWLLWVALEPFEAGNGRLGRALADRALAAAAHGGPRYYSPWAEFARETAAVETALDEALGGRGDLTPWLLVFLGGLQRAMRRAEQRVDARLAQADLRQRWAGLALSSRQLALLEHVADGGDAPLTSSRWARIAGCSPDSALRDIQRLMGLGLLRRGPGGGRSTRYELAAP